MTDGVERLCSVKYTKQEIEIGHCVLARPLKIFNAVAIDGTDSEEYKKVCVDQQTSIEV